MHSLLINYYHSRKKWFLKQNADRDYRIISLKHWFKKNRNRLENELL